MFDKHNNINANSPLAVKRFDKDQWKTRSQAVARIADRTAKNCRGHVTKVTPTFRENYLCARWAFPIQSCNQIWSL